MRIDKLLSNLKYCTRKEARKLAREGLIKLNGEPIKDVSKHIDPDKDSLDIGHEKVVYHETLTLMMNKRKGVVSARVDDLHPTVIEDLEVTYQRFDLHIAGRLDKDTEGMLILTTDGKLLHDIISPQKDVYKTYEVFTRDTVEDIGAIERPMEILDGKNEPYVPQKPLVVNQDNQKIIMKIKEGKFHQVKRMFEHIGHDVIALKRIAIGNLSLDETLAPGEARPLTPEEIELLVQ